MENNSLGWIHSPVTKLILAFILLSLAGIIYSMALNTRDVLSGNQHIHADQPSEASVLTVQSGEDILQTIELESLYDSILNDIYTQHYQKTDKIERGIRFTSELTETDENSYKFSLIFLPSNTNYDISLTILDAQDKTYSLEVR